MKKAIFLYDYTGIMAQPWIEAGYEYWCFDGQHSPGVIKSGLRVKIGMMFFPEHLEYQAAIINDLVGDGVEFVFGFPECTHLAVSGAAHFAKKLEANPNIQKEATDLARLVEVVAEQSGAKWGAENPVSVLATLWRKPDFSFHPYEFGGYLPDEDKHPAYPDYIKPRDAYPKKTCIWHGNGFVEPIRKPVECDPGCSDQYKKLGGKLIKTKTSALPRHEALRERCLKLMLLS